MLVFKDLEWRSWQDGVAATQEFDNGFELSIVAGPGKYSSPKDESNSPDDFVSFEIAIFDPQGNWATKQFVPDLDDDVLGWQSRGQINALMLLVQSKNKK
jgi:hypothetical protein